MASMMSWDFLRPMIRKCLASRVRCRRSTKLLDCGLRTLMVRCSISSICRNSCTVRASRGTGKTASGTIRPHRPRPPPGASSPEMPRHQTQPQILRGLRRMLTFHQPSNRLLNNGRDSVVPCQKDWPSAQCLRRFRRDALKCLPRTHSQSRLHTYQSKMFAFKHPR